MTEGKRDHRGRGGGGMVPMTEHKNRTIGGENGTSDIRGTGPQVGRVEPVTDAALCFTDSTDDIFRLVYFLGSVHVALLRIIRQFVQCRCLNTLNSA